MTENRPDDPTVPAPAEPRPEWWSDAFAEMLRRLGLRHLAINPGASFRGLHDSLVNQLGNEDPDIVLCLHEEHAVSLAHGYAKVAGEPIGVALHTNVGLMHATMALFNAFCDRVPMLVLGATGPFAADERRPWIEWIHTSADQGALIRPFVKWDDQPSSGPASLESLVRADALTRAKPSAPTYVCFDAAVQESRAPEEVEFPDPARHRPPAPPGPSPEQVAAAAEMLGAARRPLVLVGRVGRDQASWDARLALVEQIGAAVLTDLKVAAGFPSQHPASPALPGTFLTPSGRELLAAADVVLSLDWVDLGGTLRQAGAGGGEPMTISCTLDQALHNGWSKDHFELAPADLPIAADPDLLVAALLEQQVGAAPVERPEWPPAPAEAPPVGGGEEIGIRELAAALREALAGHETCEVRLPLGWSGADLRACGPLDYLGQDGGAGLGSGPGMAVGAALALADAGGERLAVAVLGDGDYVMGAQALWTAAHQRLPLLVVVANNRSFFNDEVHQERMAVARERPRENRWVGLRIEDPDPDLAGIARSLGLRGHGPVGSREELAPALSAAVAEALDGAAVVVDVRVGTEGYPGTPVAGA